MFLTLLNNQISLSQLDYKRAECNSRCQPISDVVTMSRNPLSASSLSLVIGLVAFIFTATVHAKEKQTQNDGITRVVIACEENLKQDHDDYYYSHLLELALTKTVPTHGPFKLSFVPVMPITNRLLREIERGRIDVTWMPHSQNLRYNIVPIPIRLLKNLSDYRVFLIRTEDQERFSAVKSLTDLRKLKGGIGSHWPDRQVMEENGLPLVLSMSYFNLFKMLKSHRFDYFSRGIYQVRIEVETYASQGIALESSLFLRYENPVYFYVRKDNKALMERIEQGLKIALADGSFNELFSSIDNLRWGEKLLEDKRRITLQLTTFD